MSTLWRFWLTSAFVFSVTIDILPSLAEDAPDEPPLTAVDREHWAFQPLKRPAVPDVRHTGWLRTPVDAFILAELEKRELAPAREAERAAWLRRVTFDVTGLPPSSHELAAFLADDSPNDYERVIDRLLTSPGYGERWGQHWLDLARFAETDGFEHDKLRPDAWKYRDWVIAALNADVPYDQFVRLQLDGDEVGNPVGAIAAMFGLAGPDMPDLNDQTERRHNRLNELTATVGAVFLGLQFGCAQCHDHKSDPVSQHDFYRLRAVFESAVPALKRDAPFNALRQQTDVTEARLWIRGDHRRPGPPVAPAFPRIALFNAYELPTGLALSTGAGGRQSLVDALFRSDNPLTARVIANRVWQHHFGRGIFDTPSDVGLMNAGPTHPELLDWLACELRDHGWNLKRLHRAILGSSTYQQTSHDAGESWAKRLAVDPTNAWYSRFSRRRLDGETLRDALLSTAGLLSDERGGPGVMPPLPAELTANLLKGQWTASPRAADHVRRSIYLFVRRNVRYPLFEAFDRPDGNATCPVRGRSTTAPQSLVLLNSEFSLNMAQQLAGVVLTEAATPQARIAALYRRALSRTPTTAEVVVLERFLAQQRRRLQHENRQPEQLALPVSVPAEIDPFSAAAWVDACLALFNANEFVYVD